MYLDMLETFRKDRGICGVKGDIKSNVGEEGLEVAEAILKGDELKVIGEVCDIVVFCENYISCFDDAPERSPHQEPLKFKEVVIYALTFQLYAPTDDFYLKYAAAKLIEMCKSSIEGAGYCFEQCMIETCRKILSRTGAYSESAGKWEKFTTDEAKANWYSPQYQFCKKDEPCE